MLTYWEILTAIQSNVSVSDSYAQLWGKKSQNNYTIVTYTGTLPTVLTGTKAGYLHRYKIYGNTEQAGTPTPENPIVPQECGERTENLWDAPLVQGVWRAADGVWLAGNSGYVSNTLKVSVDAEITYSFNFTSAAIASINRWYAYFWDSDNTYLGYQDLLSSHVINTPSNAAFLAVSIGTTETPGVIPSDILNIMLNLGSTALSYEPYGYKLPLTSAGQDVDIYLGDDTLSTEEYVDSDTGKIYRMVDGVLTPVDPPVLFPQIPTSAGSTSISWAGEGLAPSQVELEYEKKR
jgi:hypothetical protein